MMLITQRNAPRWVILITDVVICFIALFVSYLLRFDFNLNHYEFSYFWEISSAVLIIRTISFIIGRTYQGIIRYTESKDIQRIFIILFLGSLSLLIINYFAFKFNLSFNVPRAVVLIDFMVSFFLMVLFRLSIKEMYHQLKKGSTIQQDVVIYGSDGLALIAKKALERDAGTKYKVIAFVDDGIARSGKKIDGVNIVKESELEAILIHNQIHHIIISVQNLSPEKKQQVVDLGLKHNVRILDVPPVENWVRGDLSFKQIKRVQIEDLLGRKPIVINNAEIRNQIIGKVVLVTGGAGSIGSELVRQIVKFNPKTLLILDQAESPLYEVEIWLKENHPDVQYQFIIADVTCESRITSIFKEYQPQIVYHAAAYKHVPMMENNPTEAVAVNVLGTQIVANLCHENNVEKMVFVSTDKAVNPTNVMGASKRIAEIYIQSLNAKSSTCFVTTRFGNVLGSNGSVIPLFRRQIEAGGPITVTHPDVRRYFMTIPEACQLILEAGCMSNGGEIYVFDMGKSVKIIDLAKKMILLSRLELDKDIEIIYTGLRPGEKLYEELLNNKEDTLPTHHPKILIGKVREYQYSEISSHLTLLKEHLKQRDIKLMVTQMKHIVPEFKSQNSIYEELDIEEKSQD